MLPYLSIGGKRETFWELTPKEIEIDFRAYKRRCEEQLKMAWINGIYVKRAINSSIMRCTLADKKTLRDLPGYPKMPLGEDELNSEEHKQATQTLLIAKMNKWQKFNNKKQ